VNQIFKWLPQDPRFRKSLTVFFWILILSILLFIGGLFKDSSNTNDFLSNSQPSTSSFEPIINMVIGTIIVLILMYLFLGLLRKWQFGKKNSNKNRLKIIESVRVSPRQAMLLIKVDQREFLLGSTDQALSLITEVDPVEETETKAVEDPSQTNGYVHLSTILKQNLDSRLDFLHPSHKKVM
jgi:flagellar biosynthetic protein FliO